MKKHLAEQIRDKISQDITEFNQELTCCKLDCQALVLTPEVKMLVNEDIFEKYIKLCFRKFLFTKFNRYRSCPSSYCLNVIERTSMAMTYGVCELCGNEINFESLDQNVTRLEEENATIQGIAFMDTLAFDPSKLFEQYFVPKKKIAEDKAENEAEEAEEDEISKIEKIKKLLPRPEDLKINAETIEYTICDEMSIINPKDSVMGEEFHVRKIFKLIFSNVLTDLGRQ